MTEPRATALRRAKTLPTAAGLDLLVKWANQGPGSLAPEANREDILSISRRQNAVLLLRRLAVNLDVPAPELAVCRGRERDFGALSLPLLDHLAWKARSYGYVTAGCRERTPMTPVQVSTLYQLTWGATLTEISHDAGSQNASGMAGTLKRARLDHGCATNAQLVACAFRNGWLPDQAELSVLLSGRMLWDPIQWNATRPPYLLEGNA